MRYIYFLLITQLSVFVIECNLSSEGIGDYTSEWCHGYVNLVLVDSTTGQPIANAHLQGITKDTLKTNDEGFVTKPYKMKSLKRRLNISASI